jgi:hypothetical protein
MRRSRARRRARSAAAVTDRTSRKLASAVDCLPTKRPSGSPLVENGHFVCVVCSARRLFVVVRKARARPIARGPPRPRGWSSR